MCVKIWLRAGLVRTNLKLEWSGVEWIGHELEWIGVEWSDPLHSNPLQLMPNPLNPTALLSLKCVADLLQASSTTSLAPLTASSLQHHLQHAYIYIYIYICQNWPRSALVWTKRTPEQPTPKTYMSKLTSECSRLNETHSKASGLSQPPASSPCSRVTTSSITSLLSLLLRMRHNLQHHLPVITVTIALHSLQHPSLLSLLLSLPPLLSLLSFVLLLL